MDRRAYSFEWTGDIQFVEFRAGLDEIERRAKQDGVTTLRVVRAADGLAPSGARVYQVVFQGIVRKK